MWPRSIAGRLFWLSLAGLVVALLATGLLLSELYSRALGRQFDETLNFQLISLIGKLNESGVSDESALALGDPRFSSPGTGWYWQVEDEARALLASSDSLIGTVLPAVPGEFSNAGIRSADLTVEGGVRLRLFERRIFLPELGQTFVTVSGNWSEVESEVAAFRQQAILVLAIVGLMLAGLSTLLARAGLQPLTRLRESIESIRAGESSKLDENYPREIAPLAEELNELLRSNAHVVERARSQVGNLAHGLKTPIAVLRNEARAESTELERSVIHQSDRMIDLVATYLDRAQMSARSAVVGQRADVGMLLARLAGVMGKLHRDKTVDADLPDADKLWFRGDGGDLEEMCGNLIDNACKWAKSRVTVRASSLDNRTLAIVVSDDGPGLTPEEIEKVLKRGVRLDEKTPGTGLGLDIVKELVGIYGGEMSLGRAEIGGLEVRLTLPQARPSLR